jgi:hypothetical protein
VIDVGKTENREGNFGAAAFLFIDWHYIALTEYMVKVT